MSILVMSDTHGLTKEVNQLVKRAKTKKSFDHIIHCGDFCCDRQQPPFTDMVQVRGNCDTDRSVPEEQVVEWDDLRILVVHGHKLNVKTTAMNMRYRAIETNAHIVLFGHTHVMTCAEDSGRLFVNPGSLFRPRRYPHPSFAVLNKGKTDGNRANHVKVKVSFYTRDFKPISKLGGTFSLPLLP